MSISRAELLHLARLARLSLEEGEIEALPADLAAMLAYVARLDAAAGGPDRGPVESGMPLRQDRVEPWPLDPPATAGAPGARDGFFRVPPMIERNGGA